MHSTNFINLLGVLNEYGVTVLVLMYLSVKMFIEKYKKQFRGNSGKCVVLEHYLTWASIQIVLLY